MTVSNFVSSTSDVSTLSTEANMSNVNPTHAATDASDSRYSETTRLPLAAHKRTLRGAFEHLFAGMPRAQETAIRCAWGFLDALMPGTVTRRAQIESQIEATCRIKAGAAKVALDHALSSSPNVYATPGRAGGIHVGDVRDYQAARAERKEAPVNAGGESCCELCGYKLSAERAEMVKRYLATVPDEIREALSAVLPSRLVPLTKEEIAGLKRSDASVSPATTVESAEGPQGPGQAPTVATAEESAPPAEGTTTEETSDTVPAPASVEAEEPSNASEAIADARTRKGKRAKLEAVRERGGALYRPLSF